MAIGNALRRNRQSSPENDANTNEDEEPLTESPLTSADFEISAKYELVIEFPLGLNMCYNRCRANSSKVLPENFGLFSFM